MVLRASAEAQGETIDLRAIVDHAVPIGLAGGDILIAFADALLGNDASALDAARHRLVERFGEDGLIAAAAIAANFSRNDRIANATGIRLEDDFVQKSADFREALGINAFASARNTLG